MIRSRLLPVAGCLIVCCPLALCAQEDDVKAVLRKAIDAHGGEKLLLKYKAVTQKFKGSMDFMGLKLNLTGETSFQKPDKMKNVFTIEIKDMAIQTVQIFNGKTLWISAAGQKTMEIKDEKILNEVRESLQAEGGGGLVGMLNKPYELSPLGQVKVKDIDAVGIRVTKKGQRDFNLFFDKQKFLLVKSETRSLDPMSNKEVTQEKYFSDFKQQDGLTTPRHAVIHKDGKLFMEVNITETRPLEKLDDATFAMP